MVIVRALITLLAVSVATAPAIAESWVDYGESGTGSVYSLDLDTLAKSGNTVIVWSKADHSKDAKEPARETKTRYRIDCFNQTLTMLIWIDYKADGTVIQSHMLNTYEQEARPAVPGSLGESLVQLVCSAK
jgi:hypothetical protein